MSFPNKITDAVITYVIEYPGTNLIKVGQAKYFVDRFAQLKTGSPVEPNVVCVFRGAKHERDFHTKFAHLRHHGEFYYYTAELRDHIRSSELDEHRMTRDEAMALSPRVERTVDKARREKRNADLAAIKADEMALPLETDEEA